MKTIMIVGAGFGQLPAILAAKELGYKVIAIDKNPNALGMQEADIALPIDILDVDAAISAAKQHGISGVMTMQSDLPVPTVGGIIDALGLPGNGLKISNTCSDKVETRKRFAKAGVPQPAFAFANNIQEIRKLADDFGYPCIIKAPDSSGSRGVTKVNNAAEVEPAYNEARKYARAENIIVEEYIEGLEIGAQAFSIDGKCVKVLVHNDTVSEPPYMIPTGHSFPFRHPEIEAEIEQAVMRAVDALGVLDGPSNIDLILDQNQQAKIIEIGVRIGATCLPELVLYYSGIDWVKAAVLAAMGEKPKLEVTKNQATAALIIESPADGVLKKYEIPEKVRNDSKVLEVEVTVEAGEKVEKLRKGTDRIGKIIVRDDTVNQAEKYAEYLRELISIEVE